MELPPPPSDGDVNRGPALLACIWTPIPVAIFVLGLRFYVRIKINGMGIDDYMMLIAAVSLSFHGLEGVSTDHCRPLDHLHCYLWYRNYQYSRRRNATHVLCSRRPSSPSPSSQTDMDFSTIRNHGECFRKMLCGIPHLKNHGPQQLLQKMVLEC